MTSPALQRCQAPLCPQLRTEQAKLAQFATDAKLADAVYDPPGSRTLPPGYRDITDDNELFERFGVTNNYLNPSNSEFRAALFEGPDGKVTVAFKGTTFWSRQDWLNNIQQGIGQPSDYYKQAQHLARVLDDHGVPNIHFVGHSLGGGLASAAAKAIGATATTFNAAGLNDATVSRPKGDAVIDAIHVRGDILTGIQKGPIAKAAASDMWSLDPPSGIGATLLRSGVSLLVGAVGSLGGIGSSVVAAMTARGVLLHLMGSVQASLQDRRQEVDDLIVTHCR